MNRIGLCLVLFAAACDTISVSQTESMVQCNLSGQCTRNSGSYNLQLVDSLRFNHVQPGADPANGRALFGLAPDNNTLDSSQAMFQGFSQEFGGEVVSNGRTCASCHRGSALNFGLPPPPLSASIPADDPLFTGAGADGADLDPDSLTNLDQLGLTKYRPNRFSYTLHEDDPFRQVFFWRKTVPLVNTIFQRGFLNDGRAQTMLLTTRGAIFTHTQSSDGRFGDLFTKQDADDMEAFQFDDTLSDPRLAALLDHDDPMFETLAEDPFYTVPVTTQAQQRGKQVFINNCMTCHNVPNVFNNLSNVDPLAGDRPANFPAFCGAVGRTFDIGVSERNANHLRFSRVASDGSFHTIVLPLINEDGSTLQFPVTFDIGLAATTSRSADIGRFRVPQLRKLRELGPYFHDNSARTLEEVVDYFNSDDYNLSRDGARYPIHMSAQEKSDLVAFLNIL